MPSGQLNFLFSKTFQISLLSFLFYWSVSLSLKSEIFLEKLFIPTTLNLNRIEIKLADFPGPKKPTTEKLILNFLNLFIMSKKSRKSILVKKNERGYQQCEKQGWKPWARSLIGTLFCQRLLGRSRNHGAGTFELQCGVWQGNIQQEEGLCHSQELQC